MLSDATIAAHYVGNFYGALSNNIAMWLRFSEGSGTFAADSGSTSGGVANGNSGNTWRSGVSDDGRCFSGYWQSYKVTRRTDPSLPIGMQSFITVQHADNCTNSKLHTHAHAAQTCRARGAGARS